MSYHWLFEGTSLRRRHEGVEVVRLRVRVEREALRLDCGDSVAAAHDGPGHSRPRGQIKRKLVEADLAVERLGLAVARVEGDGCGRGEDRDGPKRVLGLIKLMSAGIETSCEELSYVLCVGRRRHAVCARLRGRGVRACPKHELVGTRSRERAGLEPLRKERSHLQPALC
jgi:hypothetical protein